MSTTLSIPILTLEHFDPDFDLPFYASTGASGADIRASFPDKKAVTLGPFERMAIPTGLSLDIPVGYEVQVRPRSGLSLKTPLMVANAPGTIDQDYRGEIKVILVNVSATPFIIEHGLRLAQLVISPVVQATFYMATRPLSETERGVQGFGSTGYN